MFGDWHNMVSTVVRLLVEISTGLRHGFKFTSELEFLDFPVIEIVLRSEVKCEISFVIVYNRNI